MSKIDIYYGAFTGYRKETRDNKDCVRQRKYIARAGVDSDKIEVVVNECDIEDDWIIVIEKGLDFVEKALKEERQFIFSNGEVVPIEKVKSVSKESVEHLAKHSDLITRVPKNADDLIPDKLYTVERLTDYAVYENRFLYMLLCYLRDFISLRYNAILQLVTTYNGKLLLNKTVNVSDRKTVVQIALDEQLNNDEYLRQHNSAKEKLDRIDGLLKAVVSFLSYPLMEEVAKAPMLKPPVVETNVLKMNKNFKGAMQLYYAITAYDKPGYTVRTEKRTLNPFKEQVAEETAELVELCSFLTYEYGLGIESDLKAAYEERLKKQKEEELRKKEEQLKLLRKRIRENGGDAEEYMLLLEQRNRTLEANTIQLGRAKLEIKALQEKLVVVSGEVDSLKEELTSTQQQLLDTQRAMEEMAEAHAREIEALHQAHEEALAALREEHAQEIADLNAEHAAQTASLQEAHAQELANQQAECLERLRAQNEAHEEAIALLKAEHAAAVESLKGEHAVEMEGLRLVHAAQIAERDKQCFEERQRYEAATQKEAILGAKLDVLKKKSGIYEGNEDYTSREGFDQLEKEFKYFKAFYDEQWKLTKKKIRSKFIDWNIFKSKKQETPAQEEGAAQAQEEKVEETAVQTPVAQQTETALPAIVGQAEEVAQAEEAAQTAATETPAGETAATEEVATTTEKNEE